MHRVNFMVKPNGRLVLVSSSITALALPAYQTGNLPVPFLSLEGWEISSWGVLHAYMHSAFITTELRYPAVPLTRQLEHKRFVHPGPLVLRTGPHNSPTPTPDRDRTVSRRSEPS